MRALVLYAYPLHPARRPDRPRADHLGDVQVPMLFFTGARDTLALPHMVDQWLVPLERATLEIIPGADHSFHTLKSSDQTGAGVMEWMIARTSEWLGELADSR